MALFTCDGYTYIGENFPDSDVDLIINGTIHSYYCDDFYLDESFGDADPEGNIFSLNATDYQVLYGFVFFAILTAFGIRTVRRMLEDNASRHG